MKEYMKRKNIPDSRLLFKARTKMIAFNENMKNMYGRDNLHCELLNLDLTYWGAQDMRKL